jgi:protein TonB
MSAQPPRVARWLLLLVPEPEREFIEGDLEEEFAARVPLDESAAAAWYWRQVLATLPALGLEHLRRRIPAMTSPAVRPASGATPRKPAFGSLLLASRPPRERRYATGFVSLTLHAALLIGAVRATAGKQTAGGYEKPEVVEITSDMAPPPPPPPPPVEAAFRDVLPAAPLSMVPPEVIPPDIPPPGNARITEQAIYDAIIHGARADTTDRGGTAVVPIGDDPTFTPYTTAPRLKNVDEAGRALEREYPPMLRDAGVGGRVEVWIRLDETGALQDVRVSVSSGHQGLDEAALRVARTMRFDPAMNRDKRVPVWVSIPITFLLK